jgi:hypothetical protein
MIELKCKKCVTVLGEREADNLVFGGVTAKAPADVMCNHCGTINSIPAVPAMVPKAKAPDIVAAPDVTVPVTVQPAPVTVIKENK